MRTTLQRFLAVSLILLLCGLSERAQAENPPYATVTSGPTLAGANYEFNVSLDPSVLPDCGAFTSDCDVNGLGLNEVDILWSLQAISDCAGCDLEFEEVASGTIEHGFWGTNCIPGSTATGTACGDPGGCDNILSIPVSEFCPGVSYRFLLF